MDIMHLKRLKNIKNLTVNKKEEPIPIFRSVSEWNQDTAFRNPFLEIPILVGASGTSYENPVRYHYGEPTEPHKIYEDIKNIICGYCGQSFYLNVKEIKTPVFVLSCPFCGGRV